MGVYAGAIWRRLKDLGGKWRGLSNVSKALGIFAVVFLVSAAVLVRIGNYLERYPDICRSCHVMEPAWEAWKRSEHRSVSCVNCHKQDIISGFDDMVQYLVTHSDKILRHAYVPDYVCNNCHGSGKLQWRQVAETAGHRVHVSQQKIECTTCHGMATHSAKPPQDLCNRCHAERVPGGPRAIKIPRMSDLHCLDCHKYLRMDSPLKPGRETCLECHKRIGGDRLYWGTEAPMQFACWACHQPHKQVEAEVNCSLCHKGIEAVTLHRVGAHQSERCLTCHRPHRWKAEDGAACRYCHKDRTPT